MCLIVMVAVACGGKKKDEPGPGSSGSGSAPVAKADDGSIQVFVNDQPIAKIAPGDVAKWPRLDSLLPDDDRRLGTWERLTFTTAAAPATLERPSQNHPDKVPVVFPNKDGKPSFGMFDPVELANKGQPGFRADAITEIHIKLSSADRGGTHQSGNETADPTKLVIKITTPAGEKQLTGPEILKLPRESQPNQEDAKGWRLQQFLEAVGVTKFNSVVLVDAGGTTLPFDKKDLDPTKTVAFFKLNKRGALRFRMFTKQGTGWQAGADLAALSAIQVK